MSNVEQKEIEKDKQEESTLHKECTSIQIRGNTLKVETEILIHCHKIASLIHEICAFI
jgi:hypothetical protein